jgi:hypothetical protein
MLHFFKGSATAFTKSIALASGTNSDAGCVWRGVVPSQPSSHGFWGETFAGCRVMAVKHHERIHLSQRTQLGAQGHAVWGRAAFAPVVDGGFDVGDVEDGFHGYAAIKIGENICIKTQYLSSYRKFPKLSNTV